MLAIQRLPHSTAIMSSLEEYLEQFLVNCSNYNKLHNSVENNSEPTEIPKLMEDNRNLPWHLEKEIIKNSMWLTCDRLMMSVVGLKLNTKKNAF